MKAIKRPRILSLALFITLSAATISLYAIQGSNSNDSILVMATNIK